MFGLQMFHEMDTFQREINQLFQGLNSPAAEPQRALGGALKLRDCGDAFQIEADLPGLNVETLSIDILGRQLTLVAEYQPAAAGADAVWHRRERQVGRFEHALALPTQVATEEVEAEYRHGVLRIQLPKVAAVLPKKITVKAA